MKICLDIQALQSPSRERGIGRYVRSLLDALSTKQEITVLLNAVAPHFVDLCREFRNRPNIEILVWYPPHAVGTHSEEALKFENLNRESYANFLAAQSVGVLIVGSFFEGFGNSCRTYIPSDVGIRTAVIIYDFIPLLRPEEYLAGNSTLRKFYEMKVAELAQADCYLAISESTISEISVLSLDSSKAVNISAACSPIFRPEPLFRPQRFRSNHDLGFFLYVGGADPRKNLKTLLAAYSMFTRSHAGRKIPKLVLAGAIHPIELRMLGEKALATKIPEDLIEIRSHISDLELSVLYQEALALIMPSFHEGFGLTALEAISSGCLVISSNLTSLPEVLGKSAIYFDPSSPAQLARKLDAVRSDRALIEEKIQEGLRQAQKFSWTNTAQRVLDAIFSLDPNVRLETNPKGIENLIENVPSDISADEAKAIAKNIRRSHVKRKTRKCLVDITGMNLSEPRSGIDRTAARVASLLKEHEIAELDFEFVVLDAESRQFVTLGNFDAEANWSGAHLRQADYQSGDIFFGLGLNQSLGLPGSPYTEMQAIGVITVFVAYDFLPITHRHYWPPDSELSRARHYWLNTVMQADFVLTISDHVKNIYLKLREETGGFFTNQVVQTWYLGSEFMNSKWSTEKVSSGPKANAEAHLEAGFALVVGSLNPRRAHSFILNEFEKLWRTGTNDVLVFAGKSDELSSNLENRILVHEQFGTRLFWLSDVADEQLSLLYKTCGVLVVGSHEEGFSLPIAEALSLGTRVLARDLDVFRELYGDSITYFHGEDFASVFQNLPEKQMSRTAIMYSWQASIQALSSVFELAMHRNRGQR